jgi:hypothetical protein
MVLAPEGSSVEDLIQAEGQKGFKPCKISQCVITVRVRWLLLATLHQGGEEEE